jgi:hypothetical protein
VVGVGKVFFHGGFRQAVGKMAAVWQGQWGKWAHRGLLGYDAADRKPQVNLKVNR